MSYLAKASLTISGQGQLYITAVSKGKKDRQHNVLKIQCNYE